MPIVTMVSAMEAYYGFIGDETSPKGIPWKLPSDMKRLVDMTRWKHVLVGYKTFLYTGVLPNRTMIVLTRKHTEEVRKMGALPASSIEQALEYLGEHDELFVLGGAEVYRQCLPIAQRMYITFVQKKITDGVRFPLSLWDRAEWQLVHHSSRQPKLLDPNDEVPSRYCEFERIQSIESLATTT